MQIKSSDLQMSMRHAESASLRVQASAPGRAVSAPARASPQPASASGNVVLRSPPPRRDPVPAADHRADSRDALTLTEASASTTARDPMIRMLAQMIEWFTGRAVRCFDGACLQLDSTGGASEAGDQTPAASALAGPPVASAGAAMTAARAQSRADNVRLQLRYEEAEQLDFEARGTVHTADGQAVQFSISLQMQRSYSALIDLATAPAAPAPTDPLVINFEGTAAQLSDQRWAFDLDEDGTADAMRLPARGSALLVFDRNANGRLDDASELFGPRSGDGFASLADLDTDGNGWIDSADASFALLGVMTAADAGSATLRSLASQGIGALGTQRIGTPFSLKDEGNVLIGQVRATGLYLTEQGRVGTVQQLDVVV